MSPIYKFIYPFNTYALLTELEYYQNEFKAYEDIYKGDDNHDIKYIADKI